LAITAMLRRSATVDKLLRFLFLSGGAGGGTPSVDIICCCGGIWQGICGGGRAGGVSEIRDGEGPRDELAVAGDGKGMLKDGSSCSGLPTGVNKGVKSA